MHAFDPVDMKSAISFDHNISDHIDRSRTIMKRTAQQSIDKVGNATNEGYDTDTDSKYTTDRTQILMTRRQLPINNYAEKAVNV